MATKTKPSPWALSHRDEERERSITARHAATEQARAAEREEQWHAARLVRTRYAQPSSWLDCLGLLEVPAAPKGWCIGRCPGQKRGAR